MCHTSYAIATIDFCPIECCKSRLPLLAVSIAAAAAIVGCRNDESATSAPPILTVEVLEAKQVDHFLEDCVYIGEVAAAQASELAFELGGKVQRVLVDEGDVVSSGDPLANCDTALLIAEQARLKAELDEASAYLAELHAGPRQEVVDGARAVVRELTALHEEAVQHRQRRTQLQNTSSVTEEEYEKAVFAERATAARLAAAESKLAELEAGTRQEQIDAQQARVNAINAALDEIATRVSKCTLRAPYAGIVAKRRVDEGDTVLAGESVLRLVENDTTEATIHVPVESVAALRASPPKKLEVAGSERPARLRATLPELDESTRTAAVVFRFDPGKQLLGGQLARLTVKQRVDAEGFWLPTSALVKGIRGMWSCFAVARTGDGGDYEVRRRDLEVLHTEGNRVFVRGTIESGDIIIKDGIQRVVSGQLVKIKAEAG